MLVTVLLVYISLVLGELTPKRIGLQRAEGIAVSVAGIVDWLARISRPFIWLLSRSTDVLVRVLGGDPNANREEISEDELRGILASQSSLTQQERELIDDVFEAGEREVREVMVPRTEVDFLDASTPAYKAARVVASMPHSRYPVFRDSQDDIVGFVHIRDILDPEHQPTAASASPSSPARSSCSRAASACCRRCSRCGRPAPTSPSSSTSTAAPRAS